MARYARANMASKPVISRIDPSCLLEEEGCCVGEVFVGVGVGEECPCVVPL